MFIRVLIYFEKWNLFGPLFVSESVRSDYKLCLRWNFSRYQPPLLWGKNGHLQTLISALFGRKSCPILTGTLHRTQLADRTIVTYEIFEPDMSPSSVSNLVCVLLHVLFLYLKMDLTLTLQSMPTNRYPPSLHSLRSMGWKQCHVVFHRANKWQNLPIWVIAAEFVYSIKTRQWFHCHAKCTYQVLGTFTSLLFTMRTSTVATAYKKVAIITSTHILTLLSLRWQGVHFLLSRINELNHDFLHWQFFYMALSFTY